jgi:hypothetical protein
MGCRSPPSQSSKTEGPLVQGPFGYLLKSSTKNSHVSFLPTRPHTDSPRNHHARLRGHTTSTYPHVCRMQALGSGWHHGLRVVQGAGIRQGPLDGSVRSGRGWQAHRSPGCVKVLYFEKHSTGLDRHRGKERHGLIIPRKMPQNRRSPRDLCRGGFRLFGGGSRAIRPGHHILWLSTRRRR